MDLLYLISDIQNLLLRITQKKITSKKQILFFLIACISGSSCGYFLIKLFDEFQL